MAPVSESLAYANATDNTSSFITPAAVFAFLFEILLVILIVLSIFAVVRRYTTTRTPQASAQTRSPIPADTEAQRESSRSFTKMRGWRSWDASHSGSAVAASRYHRGPLDDTATLLEKGSEVALPPSFPVSTRSESSQRGVSLSDNPHSRSHAPTRPVNQPQLQHPDTADDGRRSAENSLRSMLHSRSSTPNYSSTGDSRSSTWCPPHAAVEDWYRQSDAPSSSRLDHHLPAGDIVPLIVVTSCNDDFEVSSPTSTYSEPDSPTVSTPPPEFSADVHVYDSPRSSLLNPPWTWTFAGGDDGHIVDPDTPESVSQRTVFFGDKTACILPEHSASPSVRCEGRDGQYHAHNTTIVENGRPGPAMLVIAAPKLDLSPIHQFWLNGPALVTRCWAEGNADLTSGTGSEDGVEEEWETAWRSGGPLVKAFAASCSTGSIDDSEENQDENMEYFVKLHNVKAERFVSDSELCCSKLDTIGPHSKVPVEWCGRPESADSSSSWQSSNAEDSRRMAGSDSGSSFYSGSESSFTEEFEASDRFSSKDDCSLRSDISATFVQPLASGICAS